jgi:HNH endonuclease
VVVDAAALARGHAEAGERCEIEGLGPVPVATAEALLSDCSLVVATRNGRDVATITTPKRTIPADLRRALGLRYPTCGVRGCGATRNLQVDHVVPVAQGGATSIHNLWLICPHHHFLKTHRGWRPVGPPGDWDLVPPEDPGSPDDPDPP